MPETATLIRPKCHGEMRSDERDGTRRASSLLEQLLGGDQVRPCEVFGGIA